jgi:hypothetical protein
MIPVNRLVALLTPAFAAAAAAGSAWLLKHFPGLPVPSTAELTAVEALGATAAGSAAVKWLHGHQACEKRLSDAERDAKHLAAQLGTAAPSLDKLPDALFDHAVSDAEEFAHRPPATPSA